MFRNYIKIAFRNLIDNKGFALINISGLAIGITCSFLILLWVHDELSYDRFHKNGDRIYRVIQNIQFSDHNTHWAITQGPLGPALKNDFPEIVDAVRTVWQRFRLSYADKKFDEYVGLADPSLFNMFSFSLISGDASTALNNPHSIILSEKMADKYFKNEDPLGKTIKADNQYDFIVTGVMKNIPANSHLQFDFIIPFVFGREINYTVDIWNNSRFITYIMTQKDISVDVLIKNITDYLKDKPTLEENVKLTLQPLNRIHLYSDYDFDFTQGDIKYVVIFSSIGVIILLIACFNFMNLSTARAGSRAKEIGMRKVSGAARRDIMIQFFIESFIYTLLAMLLALILVDLLMPTFNLLSAKSLEFAILDNNTILLLLIAIVIITGLLSGSYPAIHLSSFKPVTVLKSKHSLFVNDSYGKQRSLFRQILVVIQFSLSVILIIASIIIYYQIQFMKEMKLGFDKTNIIHARMSSEMTEKLDAIKNELLANPDIIAVTATTNIPTYGYEFSNSLWTWDGKTDDQDILFRNVYVDYDYFKTFKMDILSGRPFSKNFATDTSAVIINEAAMKAMGLPDPVGKQLRYTRGNYVADIIGVVKNYNFRSLHTAIEPLVILFAPNYGQNLCIRINAADLSATIGYIQNIWSKFDSEHPFDFHFLNESLDNLYQSEERIHTLIRYFTFIAVFISSLGIFGLASFLAGQRTKEIGIRKVLGASVSSIIWLFSATFAKWILLSNLIAWPLAWYAANSWLQNFAYKIEISWWIFLLSGGIALVIALTTVSVQALKAGLTNPVDSLKYE